MEKNLILETNKSESDIKSVKVRDDTLDIMKALCIIFVVLGHTYTPYLSQFVYLFHVAVFFMISGYCFNTKQLDTWSGIWTLFKKRIISLWVPYVCWNFVFLLLQNIFLKFGFITDNTHYFDLSPVTSYGFQEFLPFAAFPKTIIKSFLFMNCRPFVGGLWFLGGLFFVTFAFSLCEIILKKLKIEKFHIIFSLLFLICGYYISKTGLFSSIGLTKQLIIILETEILFTAGFYIKKYNLIHELSIQKTVLLLVVSFTGLLVLMNFGKISVASNIITNPMFFIVVSFLGWYFVWSVSKLISRTKSKAFFLFCGKKTIPILALHTLCFKIITLVQILVYKETDKVILALFPVYKNSLLWALLYLVVGLGFPLLLSLILQKSKIMVKLFRF